MRSGWEDVTLAECTVGKASYGANAAAVDFDPALPRYLRITDIDENGYLISDNPKSIRHADAKGNYLERGDIVFARSGATVGKTYLHNSEQELAYAGYLIRFRPDRKRIVPEYLFLFTQSDHYKTWIKNNLRAGAQPNVNAQEYSDLLIPLPPLPEQRKIAAILRTWDEAIEKLEKALELKRKVRASLIAHTISNQTPNTPLKHFVTNVSRAVPKPLEPYTSLGLRSHCKGTFQRFVEDFNRVEMDTLYQVKANDLIVNITFAWEGAVAIVKPEDEHCLVSHRFPTYEIDLKKAYPDFVRYIIQTRRFTELMGIISPGGAGRNRVLNKKDFLEQKVWLPDLKTQKFIGDLLCKAEEDINVTLKLLATYKSQKRGLMQKLLTGAWRVQVDELPNKKEKQNVG